MTAAPGPGRAAWQTATVQRPCRRYTPFDTHTLLAPLHAPTRLQGQCWVSSGCSDRAIHAAHYKSSPCICALVSTCKEEWIAHVGVSTVLTVTVHAPGQARMERAPMAAA